MDPHGIDRPSEDQGYRLLLDRLDQLEARVSEMYGSIGSNGATYSQSVFHVLGNAIFEGSTTIKGRLTLGDNIIGSNALKEQIQATSHSWTNGAFRPHGSLDDAITSGIAPPPWATRAIAVLGGYVYPLYDVNSGSPYCQARLFCNGATSPYFTSFMGNTEVPAGLTWPFLINPLNGQFRVSLQARLASGGVSGNGTASITAVCLWMKG